MKKNVLLIIIVFLLSIQLKAQQSKTGPNRPIGVNKGITNNNHKSAIIINGVPSYIWHRGCGPTALGMLIGYYDTHGFSDLIDGDATTQTYSVDDAIANDEHYNDYSLPLDYYPNLKQDKSDLGGVHTANCIADFMETSWSSKANYWGWSWSNRVGVAFMDYVTMRNSAYQTYETYNYFSPSTSWSVFTNEIDNNRPVILLVDSDGNGYTDHFVTGIGYDVSNTTYAIYDTWDNTIHWYQWREMSSSYSWGIFGFNILKIQFSIAASASPSNAGIISGNGNYDYGQTANLTATPQTGYTFVNWTENGNPVSTNTNYSFTVTENRTLVANFESTVAVNSLVDNTIEVYPNPASNDLTIEFKNNNKMIYYRILNSFGQIVSKGVLIKKTTIKTAHLASGIYYFKFDNGKTFKVIINR